MREVGLTADDTLVDIGCGDGTLLLLAKKLGVSNATGLHATDEEASIVRNLGLEVRQGFTDSLPLPDESASSVVVCNNVLLVVPREKIPASLREIYRVAKPGARILIGEIPFEPGPPRNQSSPPPANRSATFTTNTDCARRSACCAGWSFGDFAASHSRFGAAARSPATRSPRQ